MTDTTVPTQTQVEVPQIDTAKIVEEASRLTAEQLESTIEERISEATQKAQQLAEEAIVERISGKKDSPKWVPKTYEEIVERAKTETQAEIERLEQERQKQQAEQVEQRKKAEAKKQEELKQYWDQQLGAMEEDGRLPKIDKNLAEKLSKGEKLSDDEMEDPAVKARQNLYKLAHEHKEPNLELVYYKHLNNKPAQAGRPDAPVGGARRATADSNEAPFTWEEIHNTSIDQIAKEALLPK